ncbi:hypothetical protein [Gloeothece verrucosa]|uniref:DUF2203 domain-containing protein n=1 Tax=Gloeothece verrucosa (strain PCC 7822) TaxID=497965 RepID=E0U626_GLOV7|nr:hypothetical protein [Gloeothece verrucosa]ADN17135.1 conserved hypothetical protein [Gloeothece verrucosa PCC 7822]
MSHSSPNPLNDYGEEFEQDLAKAEQALEKLKQRYALILEQSQRQAELHEQRSLSEQAWQNHPTPELEVELRQIEAQIQELQLTLESALLSSDDLKRLFWQGLRSGLLSELFWQIVRFGGIGIIIGWILKSCSK